MRKMSIAAYAKRFLAYLGRGSALGVLATALFNLGFAFGQEALSRQQPAFHANARIVLIDVVVLDSGGNPVSGLNSLNFRIEEDGREQRMTSFEEHRLLASSSEAPRKFRLPPNQYTNVPAQESSGPLTVLLFDTLNTPAPDQESARFAMLNFLKGLPPNQRVALFTLGSRLRLIQTFSGDTEVLAAAASRLLASPSPLLTTESDRQHQDDDIAYAARMAAPTINMAAGASSQSIPSASSARPVFAEKLRDALTEQDNSSAEKRIGLTLQSLAALAQMLGGYAGRKNVIWVSGGFPFGIGPDPFAHSEHSHERQFDAVIRQTANALSAAQIAVYPIDVRGVRTQGVALSSNGEGASGVDSATGVTRLNGMLMRQLTESSDEHATMDDIADQTGGKAFYGTNDVRVAMERSMEQGSTYYTLAYSPENQNWNGKFRRIDVKLNKGGYKLQYRRGYFALQEPEHSNTDSTRKLVAAVRPDMPDSTSLYLKAEILPPDASQRQVRISCLIDAQQMTFSDSQDGKKHAAVDLLTVVWDKSGKDVGHSAETVETNLSAEEYRKVLRSGLQVNEVVPVSGDAYRVRLGAVDRPSQRVGTIDVNFDSSAPGAH